ncbi:TIGR03089 family protein [Tessaracoccus rhinocerotis]|uniref:TIGR03089 family protein n=1 Tax=Tessaracoccus rhinocerotis TaxID=1689449 RepID=A0A553K500_9ACTN|nr:TIGR03089 family protein [Tessaracoccus rhinocerotis]TRY19779.1 TIGR03089 family protein [Tessaracoccus rhinocerotis]
MAISALQRRVATDPARPLFIHYDGEAGSRIELSAKTFANWVDKTCNFLDTLGVEPGESVRVELANTHPGHWVTMVWVAACWQRACTVTTDGDDVALAVAGPDAFAYRVPTVACSLHPLGLAFEEVPENCTDYAEVFSEPDVHAAEPTSPAQLAWTPDVTFASLATAETRGEAALFVDPRPGWGTMRRLLVAPLLGGGSTVVVTNGDDALVERVRRDEQIRD